MSTIFITGGTGYIGSRLIPILQSRHHILKTLVRKGSEHKLAPGVELVVADPFDAGSFAGFIPKDSIYVQLLGVPHPGPKKKDLFRKIDLSSAKASALAAKQAGVRHFVYISVAQMPTSIMKDYQECRAEGKASIEAAGLNATFIRPWYVVGPGHYWPLLFQPVFKILEFIPGTSAKAKALRLVNLEQMLKTLVFAIENPVSGKRVIEIDEISRMK